MAYDPKQLAKDTQYQHSLDIITTTFRTKKISQNAIKNLDIPRRTHSNNSKTNTIYNKWYINPEDHYKKRVSNPKYDRRVLQDDLHIYRNLRNEEFWNWAHPFEKKKLTHTKTVDNLVKMDKKIIQGFKKYAGQSKQVKRLPYIVEHILNQKRPSPS